jgi:hypothetical protein
MTINVENKNVAFASSFTTSSTSYVDLLDGPGGAVIDVTIVKTGGAADSNILVQCGACCVQNATTAVVTLGIHDGTTTFDAGRAENYQTAYGLILGAKLFTGLAAGSYTFKIRVKLSAGNQVNFNANHSGFITAMEVAA